MELVETMYVFFIVVLTFLALRIWKLKFSEFHVIFYSPF